MDNLDPRLTSFISGIVAILVPIANQTFGWHLTTGTVLTLVGALVALGALEVGHGRNKALSVNPLSDISNILGQFPALIEEVAGRLQNPATSNHPGITAAGDLAKQGEIKVKDVLK